MAKEIIFRNRVPKYPGRVVMTPVAGKANTYDMVRADEPTEEGTPLDRDAFESIIHSRLTGRYYAPTVARNVKSRNTSAVNPLPSSGWVLSTDGKSAASGTYSVIVNSLASNNYTPEKALDGSADTSYRSDADGEVFFALTFPAAIKITKYKIAMRAANYTYNVTTEFQGSNNGTTWTTLFSTTEKPESLKEYTLTSPGEYTQYRLKFTATETGIYLYEFQITGYEVNSYENAYAVSSGFPVSWDEGQRVFVQIPANANTFAVVSNTLNGVPVNTILQAGRRYELRYTGTSFVAKEV